MQCSRYPAIGRLATSLVLVMLGTAPMAHPGLLPQAPTLLAEFPLDVVPIDLAFSPDGNFVVVRGTDDGCQTLTRYDVNTGPTQTVICPSGSCSSTGCNATTPNCSISLPASPGAYVYGDPIGAKSIAATISTAYTFGSNLIGPCVSCGAIEGPAGYDVSTNVTGLLFTNPGTQVFSDQLTCNSGTHHAPFSGPAGQAAQLALTPDGTRALAYHGPYLDGLKINRLTVQLPVPNLLYASLSMTNVTLGLIPTPNLVEQADYLAVSNSRAAVLAPNCCNDAAGSIVAIADITGTGPGFTLLGGTPTLIGAHCEIGPGFVASPHDLAMTPSGTRVVFAGGAGWFTGGTAGMVAIYDATNGQQLWSEIQVPPAHPQATFRARQYFVGGASVLGLRDSVEVTETRAIVIGDSLLNGRLLSRIEVYDLASIPPGGGTPTRWIETAPEPPTGNDRAVDLAIAPDGTWAVVKTQRHNVVITNLLPAPGGSQVPVMAWIPSLGDPFNVPAGVAGPTTSDAVEMNNEWAVTIGMRVNPFAVTRVSGVVDFIQVGPPLTVSTRFIEHTTVPTPPSVDVFPADLKLNAEGSRLFVQCQGPTTLPLPPGWQHTQTVVYDLWAPSAPIEIGRIGPPANSTARLTVRGVDYLDVGIKRAAVIWQDPTGLTGAVPFPEGCGAVQIIGF